MKKKDLVWRLHEKPSGDVINRLVERKIITIDEARDLLFNNDKNNPSEENKALKEQIKFLQDTIEKLIDKLNESNNHWVFSNTYTPSYPTRYWYKANSVDAIGTSTTISSDAVNFTASSLTE